MNDATVLSFQWQQPTATSTSLVYTDSSCGLQVCGNSNPAFYQPKVEMVPRAGTAIPTNAVNYSHGGVFVGVLLVLATIGVAVWGRWRSRSRDEVQATQREDRSRVRRVAALIGVSVIAGVVLSVFGPSNPAYANSATQVATQVPAPSPAPCGAPIYKACPPQLGPDGSVNPTAGPIAPQPSGLPQFTPAPYVPRTQPLQNTDCSNAPANAPCNESIGHMILRWAGMPDLATFRRETAQAIRRDAVLERTLAHAPDLSRNDRVRQLWLIMVAISDIALLVALPLAYFLAQWWEVSQIEWKEVLPRYIAAFLAVNSSLYVIGLITRWVNDFTVALSKAGVKAGDITASKELSAWLLVGFVLVFIILIASDLIRVALLLIGTVLAGPSQVAWMAFNNDGAARGWWAFMIYLYGSTILQTVLTTLATWVVFTGQPLWSATDSGILIDTWLLIVLLLIIAIIPLILIVKGVKALGGHVKIRPVRMGPIHAGI